MKFLVTYREDTTVTSSLPLPAVMEMVEATGHAIEELKRAGKILQGGFFAVDHGGYGMFEVASLPELLDLTDSLPVRPLCTLECIPVLDVPEWGPVFKKQKAKALEMFAKMSAMAPK